MKKTMLPFTFAVLFLASLSGKPAQAVELEIHSSSPYAAQIGMDSFNYSVRKRLDAVRMGAIDSVYAGAAPFGSDSALAAAPATRSASVRSSVSRRQLDCVYYNGFTVWGDLYQTWAKQTGRDGSSGYRYTATAPAVGFDWTSGPVTIGFATTYNFGKLKGGDANQSLKARAWDMEVYGQYNAAKYYISAGIGYGYNHYKGTRWDSVSLPHFADYHSHSVNLDGEFGLKFNFSDFLITPHAGLRLFHDRRGAFAEDNTLAGNPVESGRASYYVWEVPLGVNLAYAIRAGGAMIIPQVKAAWIPELARRRGNVAVASAPRRARNGFLIGVGLEAKISRTLGVHVDYNANFRNNAHEHHWNLGVGFTF
ncbi:MAG: autotransporter outer membrane beta-barrel domain-containing protein [Planctomycetota bacterium]|nr:autotransporter outer membrane beta-barrel domain-containing protein [Planctomycetota bacterium]